MELGLLPEQFWQLTPGELMLLQEHHIQDIERAQELAAFSGYCAAAAVAKWWTEGLPPFDEFYKPRKVESAHETTTAEYKARYDSWQ